MINVEKLNICIFRRSRLCTWKFYFKDRFVKSRKSYWKNCLFSWSRGCNEGIGVTIFYQAWLNSDSKGHFSVLACLSQRLKSLKRFIYPIEDTLLVAFCEFGFDEFDQFCKFESSCIKISIYTRNPWKFSFCIWFEINNYTKWNWPIKNLDSKNPIGQW